MNERPRVEIGILITKDDQVLLMKSGSAHGDATWSTPGGYLEYGEQLEESAMRIVKDVTGVIITDVTFLALTNDVLATQKEQILTVWMAARYVSGTPAAKPEQTLSTLDWFSWDALPEPLFLPFEYLLTGRCYPALWDFSGGQSKDR